MSGESILSGMYLFQDISRKSEPAIEDGEEIAIELFNSGFSQML
jgi:hypothetical protein